jgi:hypothetical protein
LLENETANAFQKNTTKPKCYGNAQRAIYGMQALGALEEEHGVPIVQIAYQLQLMISGTLQGSEVESAFLDDM